MRLLSVGLCTLCGLLAIPAQANVIQYFAGISYNNPSDLVKVKDKTFLLGGTSFYGNLRFNGTALNFNTNQYDSGLSNSQTFTVLPYGRLAKRLNKKFVLAVDVTEPFNSNLDWGDNSFSRYASTQNLLTDIDVSPKLAWSINDKWQLGGGLNFNFVRRNEVNWAFPTGQTSYAVLNNRTSSFGLGYNLGLTYIINKTNFLGLTYYSRIRQKTQGNSVLGNSLSEDLLLTFNMPATTIVSYVHLFSQDWLINLQGFRSEWHINQYLRFYNTAAPPPLSNFVFTMHFRDAYAALAAVRHQCSEKFGLTLAGMVDFGPEHNDLRTIALPSGVQYFLGLVGDYKMAKHTTLELLVGHVISNPSIQNTVLVNGSNIPFNTGEVKIDADIIDLKIKIEM